jgi:hypothetical protein
MKKLLSVFLGLGLLLSTVSPTFAENSGGKKHGKRRSGGKGKGMGTGGGPAK